MELLRLLSDGQFHSGVQLADAIGVSRTTISKRITQWTAHGLVIDSVVGKGYRLHSPIQWLDKERILSAIPSAIHSHISIFETHSYVSSTNDVVATYLSKNTQSGVVCITEMQGAGRGRRGRGRWHAGPAVRWLRHRRGLGAC